MQKNGKAGALPAPFGCNLCKRICGGLPIRRKKKEPIPQNTPFGRTMAGHSAYQMPKTVCMPRLTAAMATQQQKPVKMGFPPVLMS